MPGILFRAIFVDLCKVLFVTTSVLVTVIAFGAAIKPLSENLLGPADILTYMAYATVPMLQFALPFAAAFAGVIVYHRLTTDNEIIAMAASGMPYRRIMLPAVVLGIVLTGGMIVLVDTGVPTFWRAIKQLVAKDVTRGFVAYVDRGEALPIGTTEIYADEAYVEEGPTDSGAAQRLRLVGVAALEFAEGAGIDRQPIREFTAQFATVDVHRIGVNSFLKVTLQNATVFNHGDRAIAGSAVVRPEAVDLGRTIEQGPKGLSFVQLLKLRNNIESDPEIAIRRTELQSALAVSDVWKGIADAAHAGRPIVLRASGESDGTRYELLGGQLVGATLAGPNGGPILLTQLAGDGRVRSSISAPNAALTLASTEPDGSARLDLLADDATVRDPNLPKDAGTRRPVRLADLSTERGPDRSAQRNEELLAAAAERLGAPATGPAESANVRIAAAAAELTSRIKYVRDEIVARIVQRTSTALTAILMLLAASIFAIWFRNRTPLFVYVLAFVPAIIDILLVSSGEQMLRRDVTIWGVFIAFSGNALLLLTCVFGAWRVGRH